MGKYLAVKHIPAQRIAQPLVIQYQVADGVRQLCSLPMALLPARFLLLVFQRCFADGPDRIGRRTEFVRGHMGNGYSLPSRQRCHPRDTGHVASCRIRNERSVVGLLHRYFTAGPGAGQFDRSTRPVVVRPRLFEVMQYVVRTVGRPYGEKLMVRVRQSAATAHRDKP